MHREALAPVVERRAEHLVPDRLDVARVPAFYKARQVSLYNLRAGRAADRHADARRAVVSFNFDDQSSERVDAPGLARAGVLRVAAHGIRDGRVTRRRIGAVDPVLVGDVVAVGALVAVSFFYVSSYFFDAREDLAALVSHDCCLGEH